MTRRLIPSLLAATAILGAVAPPVPAAPLATGEDLIGMRDAAQVVTVDDVKLRDGAVTGTLRNKSPRLVKDVRLLINFIWFWKNERHPGTDNPGRAEYVTIKDEIPAAEYINFTYRPSPPLPDRADGSFRPQVNIVGFAEVGE